MGVVRGQRLSALCGLLLGALTLLPGCGPQQEERQDARQSEVTVAEWDWLQQTRQRLDEQRERLAQLEAKTEGKPPSEELARLRKDVGDLGEDFNRRLVEYVNTHASDPASGGET